MPTVLGGQVGLKTRAGVVTSHFAREHIGLSPSITVGQLSDLNRNLSITFRTPISK